MDDTFNKNSGHVANNNGDIGRGGTPLIPPVVHAISTFYGLRPTGDEDLSCGEHIEVT